MILNSHGNLHIAFEMRLVLTIMEKYRFSCALYPNKCIGMKRKTPKNEFYEILKCNRILNSKFLSRNKSCDCQIVITKWV